jgi:hypothetical protein
VAAQGGFFWVFSQGAAAREPISAGLLFKAGRLKSKFLQLTDAPGQRTNGTYGC